MIWLQLIIPVVVICSKLTEAEVGKNEDCYNKDSGIAKINYYREGFICSGVHLKPWIVLTIAECVNKRQVDRLSVTVKIYPENEKDVEVKSIDFDPDYYNQKNQHNLALLYIYGQMEWCVGRFFLPPNTFTQEIILSGTLSTLITEWIMNNTGEVEPETSFANASKEYKDHCRSEEIKDCYCVKKQGLNKYMNNKGMPFYFNWSGRRGILALYMGIVTENDAEGSLFQAVLPSHIWINEFIHEHPVPPS